VRPEDVVAPQGQREERLAGRQEIDLVPTADASALHRETRLRQYGRGDEEAREQPHDATRRPAQDPDEHRTARSARYADDERRRRDGQRDE